MLVHLHEIETEVEKPVLLLERFWEPPTFVTGQGGDNILSVLSPNRIAVPLFVRDGREKARAEALQEATPYESEVHLVLFSGKDLVALFAAPQGARIKLSCREEYLG